MLTSCHAIATCTTPHPRNRLSHKMAQMLHIFLSHARAMKNVPQQRRKTSMYSSIMYITLERSNFHLLQSEKGCWYHRHPAIQETLSPHMSLENATREWETLPRMGIHSLQIVSKVIDLDKGKSKLPICRPCLSNAPQRTGKQASPTWEKLWMEIH